MDLSGVFPALTTPFDSTGAVSTAYLQENIRRYLQTGVAGFTVIGSTGESVLLTKQETDAVLAAAREAIPREKRAIAGTGAESTAETIQKTKRAAELGYDVALVKTPHYYKPAYNARVFLEHYRRVADASPIPVMLYSVPVFTGVALEPPEVIALSEHPNIVGMKDSSGDLRRVVEIVAGAKPGFQLVTGAAAAVQPSLAAGAVGNILALACVFPEKCAELFEAQRAGQTAKARELQGMVARLSRIVAGESIPGIKFAMDLRGYRGGLARPPLLPLQDEQKKRVTEAVMSAEPVAARA